MYFIYDNFYMTCILMRLHVCLCTHVRIHCLCGHVCVRRMQILLFYLFLEPMSTRYMFTLVPEIHGWRCAIRVGESVIRVLRHGLCVGLFYCFNDAVCFMYFVRNDEIKKLWTISRHSADYKLTKICMFFGKFLWLSLFLIVFGERETPTLAKYNAYLMIFTWTMSILTDLTDRYVLESISSR